MTAPATLKGKRVVVIGGTSGIGFAVAEAALADGAHVIVGSSRQSQLDSALQRRPGLKGHVVDVTSEASVAAFFGQVGALDHFVTTAGNWPLTGAPLPELDLDKAGGIFAVRYWGAVTAAKYAARAIGPDGSITFTDGLVAHRPRKSAYLATSMAGAVEHLARGLSVELAPVRVNAVCPGVTRTEALKGSLSEAEQIERFRTMTANQPLARVGEPAELAEAYLFLMRCGFITGQTLIVDGGRILTG